MPACYIVRLICFGPVASYSIGTGVPYGVALGDINSDGRLDIVARNADVLAPNGYQIAVLLAQASGGFAPATNYPLGSSTVTQGIAVGDVNGDGQPDIITVGGRQEVIVLLGKATGFAAANTYSMSPNSYPLRVTLGDVNGDGRVDIVTGDMLNTADVLLGQAGGSFQAPSIYSTGSGIIALGDVNGDGRIDLVSAVSILLGQATGFAPPVALATAPYTSV